MSPSCLSQCYETPVTSKNVELKKYDIKSMELSKVSLFLIFISGMIFAVISTLFSNYLQKLSLGYVGKNNRHRYITSAKLSRTFFHPALKNYFKQNSL